MRLPCCLVLWAYASACSSDETAPGMRPGESSTQQDAGMPTGQDAGVPVGQDAGGPPAERDSGPVSPVPDGSIDGTEDEPASADPEPVDFEIPLAPLDEGFLSFFVTEDEATGEATPQTQVIRLAFGQGYPAVMRFELSSLVLYSGSGLLISTELELEAVSQVDPGLEVDLTVDRQIQLEVREAGTHVMQLEAVARFDDGTMRPFALPVSVAVIPVAGVDWSSCIAPSIVVSGSALGNSRLYPLDDAGNPFEPLNTEFNRAADLILRARAGTQIEAPTGVDSLLITGPSQTLEVHSNFGPVTTLELIQPEEVDTLEPVFVSSEGGARGGSTAVANGGELALDFAAQPHISVHPGARFEGIPLCGSVDPRLFELTSSTPETCTIAEDGCAVRGCPTNDYVPAVADLIAPGTCSLSLVAPSLNHGNGLAVSFSASFSQL